MVSIIVPVFNVEPYLKKCIDCILAQTYRKYELILIDDGSSDASGKICDEYINHQNVQVIHKSNEGLGITRNLGIELAKGRYISFLDSDDYWASDALEELMKGIDKYGADTCLGGYIKINDCGKILYEKRPLEHVYSTNKEVMNDFFPKLIGSLPSQKDAFRPSVWNAVYSMEIIQKYKIKFPSEREFISEDIIFNMDYYQHSKCVYITDKADYFYRETPNSLTQKYRKDRFRKNVYLYKEILFRLSKMKNNNSCILRAKRQFFVNVRECIFQECNHDLGLNRRIAINHIKEICNNNFTQKCVATYPIKKLHIYPKIFLLLVKYKYASVLYFLFKHLYNIINDK